jgi:hypothetical protein
VELGLPDIHSRSSRLTVQVNKVHRVHTISSVARMLGQGEDGLCDIAGEMDAEDGLIWVYGAADVGVMAFTDFGVETLTELVQIYKAERSGPDAVE